MLETTVSVEVSTWVEVLRRDLAFEILKGAADNRTVVSLHVFTDPDWQDWSSRPVLFTAEVGQCALLRYPNAPRKSNSYCNVPVTWRSIHLSILNCNRHNGSIGVCGPLCWHLCSCCWPPYALLSFYFFVLTLLYIHLWSLRMVSYFVTEILAHSQVQDGRFNLNQYISSGACPIYRCDFKTLLSKWSIYRWWPAWIF